MSDLYSSEDANNLTLKYRAHSSIRGVFEVLITLTIYFASLIGSCYAYQHNHFICIIPLIFLNALSVFSDQHEESSDFTFQTTSFYKLPTILDWFTGSIGYHHIHHVFPIIPGYNLKKCYRENPILHAVHTVTLRDTLKIMQLRLYDDVKLHRLLSWKEYYQQYSE